MTVAVVVNSNLKASLHHWVIYVLCISAPSGQFPAAHFASLYVNHCMTQAQSLKGTALNMLYTT
jgi:hypothetical protein